MKKERIYLWWGIVALLGIDQLSKYFFYTLQIWINTPLLEPLFNTGISRGIAMPLGITVLISLLCIGLFGYFYKKWHLTWWECGLFLAGTLGNLIDRGRLWGVRDFIAIGNFPVFNFADIYLTLAVVLLCGREIYRMWSVPQQHQK
jgi:signal peptidase II